ncbi:MAG: aromatic ring-hydroxylating dioxygenase subunit alpha [Leptolyngbyaceae cyanobacterium MO_188.B28]|nr:aromatic ring-hydroxylating dioxygenase subunit alpha [Leptolyngbyaceae cyanobacterium MO_188.B28]
MATTPAASLPRNCTFSSTDWQALAPFWHPVAFSHDITTKKPYGTRLLDERLVIYRVTDGAIVIAQDLCLHRGAPLSLGRLERDCLICPYHGVQYDRQGQCVLIPAQPQASIPARLKLKTYPAVERYGLVWTRLVDNGPVPFPAMDEWSDPDYIQILPEAVDLNAAAGRQVEGFLDVSHFGFIHARSFGEQDNTEVPDYPIELTPHGFRADYVSSVSNYAHGMKHLAPPDFRWRRLFEAWLPFTAKLTVFFPNGQLHILNAASPLSARQTRVFVPICRNFDQEIPLQDTLDFNHQIFAEDKAIVEEQWPEDLPIKLADEVHIAGDKSSITYRNRLAALGLGQTYTA